MPHSMASVPMSSENLVEEDSFLPDAPEQNPTEDNGKMHMSDVTSQLEISTGEALRTDVKLEDLFNDDNDDEDDDFSGFGVLGFNNESGSPEAPLWESFCTRLNATL